MAVLHIRDNEPNKDDHDPNRQPWVTPTPIREIKPNVRRPHREPHYEIDQEPTAQLPPRERHSTPTRALHEVQHDGPRISENEASLCEFPKLPPIEPNIAGVKEGAVVYHLEAHQNPEPRFGGYIDKSAELGADGGGWLYFMNTQDRPTLRMYLTARQIRLLYVSHLDAMNRAKRSIPDTTWEDVMGPRKDGA